METNKQANEKIVVKIDPELKELIPGFLQNRHADIPLMLEALKKNDYTLIERTGHGMKGAGAGFGFDAVTEIGMRIETAARQKDADAVAKGIEELSHYVSCVKVSYE